VGKSQQRMAERHAWTGIAHDGSDPFSHLALVAVDGAIRAGRLVLLVRAALKALLGVTKELPALGTQA
jgi:hypothetical protein